MATASFFADRRDLQEIIRDNALALLGDFMKFRLRTLLIFAPLLGIVLAIGFWLVLGFTHGLDDAYAEWGASDMLIDYMESHDGRWPPNWEALRANFAENSGRVGGWSFEKFCDRIYIDFEANPVELHRLSHQSEGPTFDVVGARLQTGVHMGQSPNNTLYEYFRSKREWP